MLPKPSTNENADALFESRTIKQVRLKVLNTSLVVFSLAAIPAQFVNVARFMKLGWQPFMLWQFLVMLVLWGVTLFRHSISFQKRVFSLLSILFLLGLIGFWTFGLVGAGLYFFLTMIVLSTVLFGSRWGWISLGLTLTAILSISLTVVTGYTRFEFDLNAYATNTSTVFAAILTITLFLYVITSILAEFHTSLIDIIKESNTNAKQLAEEVVERRSAEKAKAKSKRKFQKIVENMKDVYFETALDGTIIYCSPSGSEVSGYSHDELIGGNAGMLYSDSKDRQLLLNPLDKHGQVRDLELVFKKKNGEIYDVSFNADFSFDEKGEPTGLFGTIRDITTTKKIKELRHRAKKMETVETMAGGVAHDLNNILSGIVTYPELLLLKLPLNSDLRKPIEAIRKSGQRAALVVADLLTVAKGAATAKENHDLHFLIEGYFSSPKHLALKTAFPKIAFQNEYNALKPTVFCSPVHINKCLMNLVQHAIDSFVDEGSICVSTCDQTVDETFSLEHSIKEGDYVVLSVSDTGPGMSQLDKKHIFEPFYTKKSMGRKGTGLELTIVWNAVQSHDGTIHIHSTPDGTSFQLYFPKVEEQIERSNQSGSAILGTGEKILIIDDELNQRDIASQILGSHGYKVEVVSSGEEAILYFKKHTADLIILDMLMDPGINGHQTYKQIINISPNQKAIIASGFSQNLDVEATLQLGAGEFIKKPYTIEQLCSAVHRELIR